MKSRKLGIIAAFFAVMVGLGLWKVVEFQKEGVVKIGNYFLISAREANSKLQDLTHLLQSARAIPYLVKEEFKGLQFTQIETDSFLTKLGLKEGDVLTAIEDIQLNDPTKALTAFRSLQGKTGLKATVLRDGKEVSLRFQVL